MGRKIISSVTLFSLILFSLQGCADFEFHVKNEARGVKPAVILIGNFEIRNMDYDPFIPDEFKDALKFEFFKRGYNPLFVSMSEDAEKTDSQMAAKICSDYSGDILIKGVISQRESGFLADREVDTLISITVFDKNGKIFGEGYYHDNEYAGDESLRRNASEKFVSRLLKNLEQAE